MSEFIYMDYAATTPVDPRVIEEMLRFLGPDGIYGNPASSHWAGIKASASVEEARARVASVIGAKADEIVWTSGATESNNLALKGVANYYQRKGRHIVTARTEHKAVIDSAKALQDEGFDVTYLKPDETGLVSPDQVFDAIREDTILVSLMHVNNEIGIIQDIQRVAETCRERGVFFHVDAAQSLGKLALDLEQTPVDLLSFCAHKIYGPKGIGGLFVRRNPKVNLTPQQHGGGHEFGFRSGSLATAQIAGLARALEIAEQERIPEVERLRLLKDRFLAGLRELPGVFENGPIGLTVPHILNLSFSGVEGESLLYALKTVAVSSGSACTSATREPSYVLKALGRDDILAQASIRFSFGRFTTEDQVDKVMTEVLRQVPRLRALSPID